MGEMPEPYSFSVEPGPGYLHVRVSGANTAANVARYVEETLAACRDAGVRRVLVEEDLTGPSLRPMQMFDLIEQHAEPRPPALTIAYVDRNPEHDVERLRFAETVAVNRGFMLRLFQTVREAELWLAAL